MKALSAAWMRCDFSENSKSMGAPLEIRAYGEPFNHALGVLSCPIERRSEAPSGAAGPTRLGLGNGLKIQSKSTSQFRENNCCRGLKLRVLCAPIAYRRGTNWGKVGAALTGEG